MSSQCHIVIFLTELRRSFADPAEDPFADPLEPAKKVLSPIESVNMPEYVFLSVYHTIPLTLQFFQTGHGTSAHIACRTASTRLSLSNLVPAAPYAGCHHRAVRVLCDALYLLFTQNRSSRQPAASAYSLGERDGASLAESAQQDME